MMREALDQWDFVIAAYAVGLCGTIAMVAWAWWDMRRAGIITRADLADFSAAAQDAVFGER